MINTIFGKQPNNQQIHVMVNSISIHIKQSISIIFYVTALSTIAGGILHLLMIGPTLKPANFPMEMLPYTDGLFILSGILQIFWCVPMIMRWGYKWYYAGLVGTIGLSILLLITRIPNGIIGLPLEDKNPMALLTEVSQLLYIGSALVVIAYSKYCDDESGHLRPILKDKLQNEHPNITDIVIKEDIHGRFVTYEDASYLLKKIEYKININSRDSRLWIARGMALRKLGDNFEAVQSFNEAIKLDPTEATAWYQKGLSFNILGKKKEAVQIYEIARLIEKRSQH